MELWPANAMEKSQRAQAALCLLLLSWARLVCAGEFIQLTWDHPIRNGLLTPWGT